MALRLSPHMTVMQNAVQKASQRLLRDFAEVEQLQVSVKGPGDFVSQADLRAEQTIREELSKARPGYAFLMEEGGAVGSANWAWRWVVDPLDGTTNFLHGVPHWCISVGAGAPAAETAARDRGRLRLQPGRRRDVLGREGRRRLPERAPPARLGPARDQGRAVRHRHPVRRRRRRAPPGLRPHPRRADAEVAGIRRFGAAALDLAWVAAGRYDGYWELGLKPWDVAAGALIVREAGGYATDAQDGDPRMERPDVVAANPHLHPSCCEVVADGLAAARRLTGDVSAGWLVRRDPAVGCRTHAPSVLALAVAWRSPPSTRGAQDQRRAARARHAEPPAPGATPARPAPAHPPARPATRPARQGRPARPATPAAAPAAAAASGPPGAAAAPGDPAADRGADPPAAAAAPAVRCARGARARPAPIPGGVRVTFGAGSADLNPATEAALRALRADGRSPAAPSNVYAYAAGVPDDPSTPRRLSLSRALAVRAVLISEGIASTRIYVRALGAPRRPTARRTASTACAPAADARPRRPARARPGGQPGAAPAEARP